ncbi:MAG: hypothetical protein ACN4GR_00315 [Arenicellales bacterium]
MFLFIVISLSLTIGAFEYYTGYFKIKRLQSEIVLVKSANDLVTSPSSDKEIAKAEERLKKKIVRLVNQGSLASPLSPEVVRFFAAFLPWLLFSLMFLSGLPAGDKSSVSGLLGAILFGVVFSSAGLLLPSTWPPIILYIGYPVAHFVIIIGSVLVWGKLKGKKKS